MALKLSLFYDIKSPNSWIFFKVLRQKIPEWRKYRQITIEYFPVNSTFLHREIYGTDLLCDIVNKKNYAINELNQICDFYNLEKQILKLFTDLMIHRSSRALYLFLNLMRQKHPEYYQNLVEKLFEDFWIGREIGIPFGELDKTIMHIDDRENHRDMVSRELHLLLEERITSIPWLRIDSIPNNQKLFGFTNILRLELLDELIKTPFYNPLNYSTEEIIYKKDEEEKTVLEQWLDRNRLKRAMKFVEKV
uniref:Uncharacterized protein n=1 Tax=Meloidogyne enterolobii TaxID=390850 RepID=A0A6V7UUT2_MELEN|nr:unnamed protein product [Meloidogyne enterolobii]